MISLTVFLVEGIAIFVDFPWVILDADAVQKRVNIEENPAKSLADFGNLIQLEGVIVCKIDALNRIKEEIVTEANANSLIGTVCVLLPSSSLKKRMTWTIPYLNPLVIMFSSLRSVHGLVASVVSAACIHVIILSRLDFVKYAESVKFNVLSATRIPENQRAA
jgi:hypothetical protein